MTEKTGLASDKGLESCPDVWQAVVHLERNQERISAVLESVSETLKQFNNEIGQVENRLTELTKTKWTNIYGAVGAASTFILMFGGIIVYAWGSDVSRIEGTMHRFIDTFGSHTKDGHPFSVIQNIDSAKERFKEDLSELRQDMLRHEERINKLETMR
jgi:prefoldin subunit 5